MTRPTRPRTIFAGATTAVAATALLAGCVLRNTSEAPHYFSAGSDASRMAPAELRSSAAGAASAGTASAPTRPGTVPLRLARVRSASYLGERMVWRTSDVERGLYEQRRWTEPPASMLEEALARSLFQGETGLQRSESGSVALLDAKLLVFDEVVGPPHEAEVRVSVQVTNPGGLAMLDQTFGARAPIADQQPSSTARAMGVALQETVAAITAAVEQILQAGPARVASSAPDPRPGR